MEGLMQKAPDPGYRVDDGPLQLGNDWPGTFFRGDHSGGISDRLRGIARILRREMDGIHGRAYATYLEELADTFSQCIIKGD
jgi:hypothetical protein